MEGIQDKDYNFLGNDKFPNLNERLLHERKLKSGYLERRCEPSRISLRFLRRLKNKSSMLKKNFFKRISSILIPKSSKLHYGAPFVSKLFLAVDYQLLYKSVRWPLI